MSAVCRSPGADTTLTATDLGGIVIAPWNRPRPTVAAALAAAALLAGCSSTSSPSAPTATETSPAASGTPSGTPSSPAATPRAAKPVVVLISIDGLNPDAIRQLDAQDRVPTLRLLMKEGASTLNARTAYEQTNTLPNHTGMLTGLHIDGSDGHHVTFNAEHGGNLDTVNGHYVPGVFDPAHDAGMSTLFLAEKVKFDFLVRSWNTSGGAADRTGRDNGRNKLDLAQIDNDPARLTATLLERFRSGPPRLTFLHISGPDEAGHGDRQAGFMGRRYLDAVAAADVQLGTILDEVRTNPRLRDRTTIVLTADHGGRGLDKAPGFAHRAPDVLDNYRIPFIVWGPGTPAGKDLYALNRGTRTDPGTARPDYTGPQPIRNLDAADLVLSILGLPPLPETLPGGLEVLQRR